jgi:hypothetical protein
MNYPMRTVFAKESRYRDVPGNIFSAKQVYPVDYGTGALSAFAPTKNPASYLTVAGNRVALIYPKNSIDMEKNSLELLAVAGSLNSKRKEPE